MSRRSNSRQLGNVLSNLKNLWISYITRVLYRMTPQRNRTDVSHVLYKILFHALKVSRYVCMCVCTTDTLKNRHCMHDIIHRFVKSVSESSHAVNYA